MKAWTVTTDMNGDACVIVFANTRNQAKSLGMRSEWFVDCDWTEVYCRRLPEMDGKHERQEPHCLNGESIRDQRWMRSLGWYEVEGSEIECQGCKLYPWGDLPESHIEESEGGRLLCKECREKKP
jgi:hypothetical protein